MRAHVALTDPVTAQVRAAALAEAGAAGVFSFEGPHDVFTPLVLASQVGGLDLLTNVAIAFPRNPIHLAHAANDLQVLSGGRFSLGLGTQVRAQIEKRFGAEFERPVARMRELVGALRSIFAAWGDGQRLDVRGEFYRHTLMTPMFNPGPNPHGPPPILLGALGPQMTRLAGEVADGLLVMPFNSAAHVEQRTMPALAEGAARAGREVADVKLVPEVILCVGRDDAELAAAEAGTRFLLGFYGSTPSYRPVLEVEGHADLQPELNRLSKAGEWQEMARQIPDELVHTIAAHGTPRQVAAEIRRRFAHLIGEDGDVCVYTPYAVADDLLAEVVDALANP